MLVPFFKTPNHRSGIGNPIHQILIKQLYVPLPLYLILLNIHKVAFHFIELGVALYAHLRPGRLEYPQNTRHHLLILQIPRPLNRLAVFSIHGESIRIDRITVGFGALLIGDDWLHVLDVVVVDGFV